MAMLDEALRYAKRGWRVFPCRPKDKNPLTPAGFKNATTEEGQIHAWWQTCPDANIGLATGNGLYVLDIDGPEGEFSVQEKEIPDGPQVKTGKGRHCYFRTDEPLRLFTGRLPHIDGRGEGGYVIAPPSVHPSGAVYEWVEGTEGLTLPECPEWLADLTKQRATPAPSPRTGGEGQAILAGQRNASLASLAGTMRKRGMSAEAIEAALLEENRNRCDPPLPEDEVRRIAGSVARYAPADDDAELRARAAKAGVTLEQARRLLQGNDEMNPLERLSAVFRVPVAEVLLEVQGESRNFRLVLEGGRTVPLGSGEDLHTLRKVKGRLLDHERVTLNCTSKEWPQVLDTIAKVAREVELADPDRECVIDCLKAMWDSAKEVETVNGDNLDTDEDSKYGGISILEKGDLVRDKKEMLYFRLNNLRRRIEIDARIKLTLRQITGYLRAFGFEQRDFYGMSERSSVNGPQFKKTHARYWCGVIPNE